MSRTITFKGPAAAAFVRAQVGEKLESEDEKLDRVATLIYGQVHGGSVSGMQSARAILRSLLKDGLDKTSEALALKPGEYGKRRAKSR